MLNSKFNKKSIVFGFSIFPWNTYLHLEEHISENCLLACLPAYLPACLPSGSLVSLASLACLLARLLRFLACSL